MNVLFLFVSLPNLKDEESLFASLIYEFKSHGHNVYVSSRGGDSMKKSEVVLENAIPVLRIKSAKFTGVGNPIKKALAYQQYVIKQKMLIKKHFGKEKIDLIISHSLPPELAYVVSGLKRFFRCKFYLLQTDYTWQDAVAYGMFKRNGLICRYYRYWEKKLMQIADRIGCPTDGNIDFIRNEYPNIPFEKFGIVRFWQKAISVEKNDTILKKLNIDGKFVAVYGGSVGKAQRIEHVVDLASKCKELTDVVFLIIGRGVFLSKIKQMVVDRNLTNVLFCDYMPNEEYLQVLKSCQVGLLILNEMHATPNFPSKTMSYLNLGVPILAAIDRVTDYGKYLDDNEIGLWSIAGDADAFKQNLLKYYNSAALRERVSKNGMEVFLNTMQPSHAYNSIVTQCESILL